MSGNNEGHPQGPTTKVAGAPASTITPMYLPPTRSYHFKPMEADPMDERFVQKINSGKLECRICGRSGYAGGRWMNTCRQPHDFTCNLCPKAYPTKQALGTHWWKAHG